MGVRVDARRSVEQAGHSDVATRQGLVRDFQPVGVAVGFGQQLPLSRQGCAKSSLLTDERP